MRSNRIILLTSIMGISGRDPFLCRAYGICEKELPPRVFAAHQKCQKEHVGHEVVRCSTHKPLFKDLVIPSKIFDCIVEVLHVLTPEEKKIMIKFEECAKKLQVESCSIVDHHAHRKHHHHHHHGR
ncbi:uncharacterized protein [Parasteatoda tepidariorum]|uniref:uncharacterized protein isoform X2 n=1 Tax=Parasteatoda tepidariorum TaxID=114398 RepID=UPI001C726300|nr:uncharacterized protein LOC107441703 isoform X2 [Parasteatoda tepidariorum]